MILGTFFALVTAFFSAKKHLEPLEAPCALVGLAVFLQLGREVWIRLVVCWDGLVAFFGGILGWFGGFFWWYFEIFWWYFGFSPAKNMCVVGCSGLELLFTLFFYVRGTRGSEYLFLTLTFIVSDAFFIFVMYTKPSLFFTRCI